VVLQNGRILTDRPKTVNPFVVFLEFRYKESGEEKSVGLVYVGKVGRGGRGSEGWETFGI